MIGIISLLISLSLLLLVTRIGAMALMLTGMSREAAPRLQSCSSFTGVGFTTNGSESVVNHPVRRRIVMLLISAGLRFGVDQLDRETRGGIFAALAPVVGLERSQPYLLRKH